MDMKFEMETVIEIWNNADKSCYEIGEDRDGLGCVEIRYRDEAGKIGIQRMTFAPKQATLVAKAIERCVLDIEEKERKKNSSQFSS